MSYEPLVANKADVLAQLEPLIAKWLPTQRWCASESSPTLRVLDNDYLVTGSTNLLWMLVELEDGAVYQVPIGISTDATVGSLLYGQDAAVLGKIDIEGDEYVAYDAMADPSLTRPLLTMITDGSLAPKSVRPMGAEQSNTSLVYDSRHVLKLFRRLHPGNNPDLEVTRKLTEVEFPNIAQVIATWQRGDYDLAVCQPFLWDGTEGWKLALGSARDFLGADIQGATSTVGAPGPRLDTSNPAEAGGDFASEACRLGNVTGELHISLSEVFPTSQFDPSTLADSLESSVNDVDAAQRPALQQLIGDLRSLPMSEAGPAIRVHGDYHLGQTLRSVNGWYIFDFEGEPARPLSERTKPSSSLKDVAGLLRSFHYAIATAVHEQMPNDREALGPFADAWEERNREAFREGYLMVHGIDSVLPATQEARDLLLRGFEVEKAIYELAYERAYRPNWVSIPQSALERLLPAS